MTSTANLLTAPLKEPSSMKGEAEDIEEVLFDQKTLQEHIQKLAS